MINVYFVNYFEIYKESTNPALQAFAIPFIITE